MLRSLDFLCTGNGLRSAHGKAFCGVPRILFEIPHMEKPAAASHEFYLEFRTWKSLLRRPMISMRKSLRTFSA
jgi:hypothetical protein